jgi:hypothetical protein
MSRIRSTRPRPVRAPRPPSARQTAEIEALRAELRERYDYFEAQRARAAARRAEQARDIAAGDIVAAWTETSPDQ